MTKPNKIWTSQKRSKLTFALSLSMAIIISNVMYLDITYLVGDNIEIQVFTFFKIFALLFSLFQKAWKTPNVA